MSNVIKGNVGSLYLLSNGIVKDPLNLSSFHPLANVNMLLVHIEDGGGDGTVTMINYKSEDVRIPTSSWFPLFYRGQVEHTVSGENSPRTFAQYATYIPTIVSRYNVNRKTPMNVSLTITQESGMNFVGIFATLTALGLYLEPQEFDLAYVTDNEDYGYYQYDGSEWVIVANEDISGIIDSKQYNLGQITLQAGFAPNLPITTLTDEQYKLIWQELETHGGLLFGLREDLDALEVQVNELFDDTIRAVEDTFTIDLTKEELDNGDTSLGQKIKADLRVDPSSDNMIEVGEDGVKVSKIGIGDNSDVVITSPQTDDILVLDADGNYKNSQRFKEAEDTLEQIAIHEGEIDGRLDDLEENDLIIEQDIANLEDGTTVIPTYELKANKGQANGYAPLGDNAKIPSEFIPNSFDDVLEFATYADMLAYPDKRTNTLYVVIADETTGNDHSVYRWSGSVFVLIHDEMSASEIKTLYESNANTNAFTDAEKSKLGAFETADKYYNKNYIDSLKDQNGWESELLTLTPLEDTDTILTATLLAYDSLKLQVRNTATDFVDTDIVETTIGIVTGYKIQLSDTSVFLEIGATNSTFTAPSGWELQIVGLKYTELKAVDTSYDNTASDLEAVNVQEAIDELVVDLEALENKIDVVGLDYKEYGIREVVGQSASEFERVTRFGGEIKLGSATGLVANVAIDDAVVANSFDYIPIFKREKVTISEGGVDNVFVKVPKFYIKEEWTTESGTDYHYYFVSKFKYDGYRLPLPFKREDGTERDYAYIGAYEAFLDGNNKLRSLTGQIPKVSYSRNNFRIAARALDGLGVNSKYQITDLAEYVDLVQIPFMIEFATKHSQGVFLGATSMAYSTSHTAIAEGTGVNAIVVSNATGANFVLGQTVSIGTSNSNDSVAKDRIVTQIDIDTPNAGETTITFDGTAVNIAIGNVVASRAWKTGMTDSVKVSGTHALNDGKHSIVWRGLENPFGNIWKNIDGVKISNWRGYVTENPKDYNDTASVAGVYAEPYLPLGYLNADTSNYAQDLGYDANYPYAKFPISVQASSGLFFRDYYYQNSGDRTVFVGGTWSNSSSAGLFSWHLGSVLGAANFTVGARLSYRP